METVRPFEYCFCFIDAFGICLMEFEPKKQKTQAFLFLQLIVLMHFVPVELFILEIKKKKEIFVAYSSGPPDND